MGSAAVSLRTVTPTTQSRTAAPSKIQNLFLARASLSSFIGCSPGGVVASGQVHSSRLFRGGGALVPGRGGFVRNPAQGVGRGRLAPHEKDDELRALVLAAVAGLLAALVARPHRRPGPG